MVLTATPQDLARARATLPVIDRGVARAMRLIPPPVGVSKVFVALADPDSPLYADGRTSTTIRESVGFAKTIGYVDPQQAASTGRGAGPTAPYAGSRVVLHPTAFTSDSWLEGVALHETVHAMAGQWGSADPWPTEGLAQWAESRWCRRAAHRPPSPRPGDDRLPRVRPHHARHPGHRLRRCSTTRRPSCRTTTAPAPSTATSSRGAGGVPSLRFARLAYTGSFATAIATVGERDEATLFRHVQRWVDTAVRRTVLPGLLLVAAALATAACTGSDSGDPDPPPGPRAASRVGPASRTSPTRSTRSDEVTEPAMEPVWLLRSTGTAESKTYDVRDQGLFVDGDVVVHHVLDTVLGLSLSDGATIWRSPVDMGGETVGLRRHRNARRPPVELRLPRHRGRRPRTSAASTW